jgi:acyl dehydratase
MTDESAGLPDLVGRSTGWKELVVEPGQVRRLLAAIGMDEAPYGATSPSRRFGRPVVPPTYLAVVRPLDPDLGLPPLGPGLNGGNAYSWLAPVYAGDRLRRQTSVTGVRTRTGRTGKLLFLSTETTFMRDDQVVAVAQATNIYR